MTSQVLEAAPPRRRPRPVSAGRLSAASGLGLGVSLLWLSLIVLLPIAAIVTKSFASGPSAFWATVTEPEALDTLKLSVGAALLATVFNAVFGTLIAWVLVRDSFRGKRFVEVIIDIPFALPTIVAGLVLISLDTLTLQGAMPRKFLEGILGELRRTGLVQSRRGVDGGYALALPARKITIGHVMRVMDGPLVDTPLGRDLSGGHASSAQLDAVWAAMSASLAMVLDEVTLEHVRSGRLPARVRRLTCAVAEPGPGGPA